MNIDNEISEIYNQIVIDYKKEFNEDISIKEINDIVDSQFKVIPLAMLNNKSVKLDYIGKFKCKTQKHK